MDIAIHDCRLPPQGPARGLIIFFHGYNAAGREMAEHVGSRLAPRLPGMAMRFPDGPLATPWEGQGRSWFPVEDMAAGAADGNIAAPRALAAMPEIHRYIDKVLAEEGLDESRLIIAGFSQGGTIAFFSALQREQPVAGLFSISGGALDQVQGIRSRPPVMLLAGEKESSWYSGRELAAKTHALLCENGFRSRLYLTPDNGHSIDNNGLEQLRRFAREVMGDAPAPGVSAPAPNI